jgi:hypothetical protein
MRAAGFGFTSGPRRAGSAPRQEHLRDSYRRGDGKGRWLLRVKKLPAYRPSPGRVLISRQELDDYIGRQAEELAPMLGPAAAWAA